MNPGFTDEEEIGDASVDAAMRVAAKRQFRGRHPEFDFVNFRDDFRYKGPGGILTIHLNPPKPEASKLTVELRGLSVEEMEALMAYLQPYLQSESPTP